MQNAIHKIFSGNIDDAVHSDFVKFSRGIFENRYLIEGKKQSMKWFIKTSAEFANFLVRRCLERISGEVNVKGIIVCTTDISKDCDFHIDDIKKYMGIQRLIVNSPIGAAKILPVMEKHPRAFYALSFSSGDCNLKIKAKPLKSGKSGKNGKEDSPKADFCSLKTSDFELVKDLFFDFPEFKEIKIKHTIEVKDIELPNGVSDPVEIREKSVRKGIVKRFVEVDGRKEESERGFKV